MTPKPDSAVAKASPEHDIPLNGTLTRNKVGPGHAVRLLLAWQNCVKTLLLPQLNY